MNNLKKPIFWAYAVLVLYWMAGAVFALIIGPYSISDKLPFGTMVLVGFVFLVVFARIRSTNNPLYPYLKFVPLLLGTLMICLGSLATNSLIDLLSVTTFNDPWRAFMGFNGAAMLPVGVLMILFSFMGLIVDRKKPMGETSQNSSTN